VTTYVRTPWGDACLKTVKCRAHGQCSAGSACKKGGNIQSGEMVTTVTDPLNMMRGYGTAHGAAGSQYRITHRFHAECFTDGMLRAIQKDGVRLTNWEASA
jgi:hypothetical protein